MLSELKEKLIEGINLQIDFKAIDESFIKWVKDIAKEKKANCKLGLTLVDHQNRNSIKLQSRTLKVNLTNELINRIESQPEISFKIINNDKLSAN